VSDRIDKTAAAVKDTGRAFARALDAYVDALAATPNAEFTRPSIDALVAEVSAELCRDVVIPELTPEQASSSFAPMQRFAFEAAAKRRYDVRLFTPAPK
jgi:protoheme ferro-lyase